MPELLDALGVRGRWPRRGTAATIWLAFPAAMIGIAAIQAYLELWLRLPWFAPALELSVVWVLWTLWHSHLFGLHRQQLLSRDLDRPYRQAFLVDIFPGISVGFSQMLRSAWNGPRIGSAILPRLAPDAPSRLVQASGVVVFLAATALFAAAWYTLGAARVGFVAEFHHPERFRPSRRGPYGSVRHPLFWSGIGVCWALALITQTRAGYLVAAVNSAYGLLYNRLEDERLYRVFGDAYRSYSREVPHILPVIRGRRRTPSQVPPLKRG